MVNRAETFHQVGILTVPQVNPKNVSKKDSHSEKQLSVFLKFVGCISNNFSTLRIGFQHLLPVPRVHAMGDPEKMAEQEEKMAKLAEEIAQRAQLMLEKKEEEAKAAQLERDRIVEEARVKYEEEKQRLKDELQKAQQEQQRLEQELGRKGQR